MILATCLGGAFAAVYIISALTEQPVNEGVAARAVSKEVADDHQANASRV